MLVSAATLIVSFPTFAGDYLTNTNQNAAFLRMIARGASIDVDGVYSNPAGLTFLPKDGFYLSLTGQSAFQTRDIRSTTPLWATDENNTRLYEGKASAPIIPSFHGVYKNGDWAISTAFSINGGGGKASFDSGLPMFDAKITDMINEMTQGMLTPDKYTINSAMEGRQYIYGLQLGLTYKINDYLSVFAGGRMNYFTGGYKGFLNVQLKNGVQEQLASAMGQILVQKYMQNGLPQDQALIEAQKKVEEAGNKLAKANIELDCDQSGWGLTPIIGIDAKLGRWNLAAKYEFRTNMNIENKNYKPEPELEEAQSVMAPYAHGVNTPSDIPAMLSVAAQYAILPSLRASVEYHFFDDKRANMANGKEKLLNRGTHEYLGGVEWDLDQRITVSGGFQKTSYGLTDNFQTDTSFYCSSYSLGFGARVHLHPQWSIDVAYFWTTYSDYTKSQDNYYGLPVKGTNVYSRSNKVFGLSLNYNF